MVPTLVLQLQRLVGQSWIVGSEDFIGWKIYADLRPECLPDIDLRDGAKAFPFQRLDGPSCSFLEGPAKHLSKVVRHRGPVMWQFIHLKF